MDHAFRTVVVLAAFVMLAMQGCTSTGSARTEPATAAEPALANSGAIVRELEDGKIEIRMVMSTEEWKQIQASMPSELPPNTSDGADLAALGRPELMGFWPKPRKYCVKVRRNSNGELICQKTIYESPLWAWARCAGITIRAGGKGANGQMSEGVCNPENTCGF